jgi:hypothetical protein
MLLSTKALNTGRLRFSGVLLGVCPRLVTDVSRQPIGPIFKGQAVQEQPLQPNINLRRVTPQNNEGLNYTKVCSHVLLTYSMEQSPSWEADQFSQLTKKFPAFYRTRRFFTVLTSAHHLSLSWSNSIQSPRPPPISWTSHVYWTLICINVSCFLRNSVTKTIKDRRNENKIILLSDNWCVRLIQPF